MPEIGLGKGAGVGSFASGFGEGLSRALVMNRERSDKKDLEAQRQREDLLGKVLPIYLQSGVDPADLEPILRQTFPKQFGQATGKGGKKGGGSPFEKLAGFLGPLIGMNRGTTIESGWPGGPVTMGPGHVGIGSPQALPQPINAAPGGQTLPQPYQQPPGVAGGILGNAPDYSAQGDVPPDISQTALGGMTPPAAPAQTRRTLLGVAVPTAEENARREAAIQLAQLKATIAGRRDIAASLGQTPAAAIDYGLYGTRPPASSAEPFQAIDGVDADGKPVSAVFDQSKGLYVDAITKQPIPGFHKASTAGRADEFETFLAAYAKDKKKPVDQLSVEERLDARSKYAKAGSTAAAATGGFDAAALARLAVRNPSVLQGLNPTQTGAVRSAMAADPQLQAQFEQTQMEPIRSSAQQILNSIDDLLTVDPKTGKVVGLSEGAKWLYGTSSLAGTKIFGMGGWRPGSAPAEAQSALDQITGKLVLDTIAGMKAQSRTGATGFGQLNAKELATLEAATSRLKGGLSEDKALELLKDLRDKYGKILQPSQAETVGAVQGQGGGQPYKDAQGKWVLP